MNHIHTDVICQIARKPTNSDRIVGTATSMVLREEAALKLRQKHEKYSENVKDFTWESRKKVPPKKCPDIECVVVTDSEESDFSGEEESAYTHNKIKMETDLRVKQEDRGKVSNIFYGHG